MDEEFCAPICEELERVFAFPARVEPLLYDIKFALNSERRQYHSTPILEELERAAPDYAVRVLGVARVDLFIPILTHVYGEAQLGGRSAIVSSHRLEKEKSLVNTTHTPESRLLKESVHELGHTFKLLHCKDPTCIMHYCRSIRDVDKKSDNLCRYCSILLNDEIKLLGKDWKP